ncbi:MAG: tetratricopeptide repeat protein [Chloroflexi bacterium]|nr:tetratricopeptide repeat protein [Chloroflexota bacterium]
MSTTNGSLPKKDLLSTQNIRRAIIIVGALLLVVVAAFSAYYYWDRFLPRGDLSPIEMAIEEAQQAVKENPQDPDLRLDLARIYYENRMYEEALEQAGQVLNAFPDNNDALLIVGLSNIRLDQPAEAIPPLEKFIELRKDHSTARADVVLEMVYYFVGESYMKLGQSAEAVPPLEAALEITPTDADALYQLGLAKQSLGDPEAALTYYHKAVRLVPDFTEVYEGMVECYTALNMPAHVEYAKGMKAFGTRDYELAKNHLLKAVEDLPDFAPALLGLGLTYEKLGELETAAEIIQRALDLNPHDFATRQALGRVQASLDALRLQEQSQ